MRSYKVPPREEVKGESILHKKRSTKLADLEDRTKLHKKFMKKRGKGPGLIGTLQKINKSVEKSSKKMPNNKEINNKLWGDMG